MLENIILPEPRGFCAGVDMAILSLDIALKYLDEPIYITHSVVHNKYVMEGFENRGVIVESDLSKIPEENIVFFSAHGSPKDFEDTARDNYGLIPIDTVCPLVTKVHKETEKYKDKEYSTILIGHNGHQEVIGTMSYDKDMTLVETVEDVTNLVVKNPDKVAYLTQTTLSVDETADVVSALKEKFPNIESSKKEDICYATTDRQYAAKEMKKDTDLILVVGSETSSNTKSLVKAASGNGTVAYRIENADDINYEWFEGVKNVGVTSGASAPEELVNNVIEEIQKHYPSAELETRVYIKENIKFDIPKALKNLIKEKTGKEI